MNPLTKRQREVALLLARGFARKQIAYELGISLNTVTRHVSDIYERTGVRDHVSLLIWLLRAGFLRLEEGQIDKSEGVGLLFSLLRAGTLRLTEERADQKQGRVA